MIMTLAVAIITISSFAAEVKVSSGVLNAFEKDFTNATEVTWTEARTSEGRDYYKASFVFNDQHVNAFYSTEGQLMGMTRFISSLDLPITLLTNLKKGYVNYWISDLFEVSNSDGTAYYITVENADAKIVLKSTSGGSWKVYQKNTKA